MGMRQRLGVARSLLNDPELLILDEPSNGLDPSGMAAFRQMIRSFVELDGRTVFISSHLLDEVEKIADDIAIVHEGRLVLHGSVEELVAEGRQGLRLRVDDGDRAAAVAGGLPFVTGVERRGAGELGIAVDDARRRLGDRADPRPRRGGRRGRRGDAGAREPRGALPRDHRRRHRGRGEGVIRATLRTITGRRGSFRVGGLVVLASVVVVIGVLVVVHELRPGRNPSIGGQPMLDGVGGAVWALGTVVAILLGALAGSYDVAQGTMRYLVLTGVGRLRLYAREDGRGRRRRAAAPGAGARARARRSRRPPVGGRGRGHGRRGGGRRLDVRRLPARLRPDRDGDRHGAPLERAGDRDLAAVPLRRRAPAGA